MRDRMRLKRLTLSKASHVGATGAIAESLDPARHPGIELELDLRSGYVTVFKGDNVSLIRDWAVADLADDQGESDADGEAGVTRGGAGTAARRGRSKANTPPVST